ncbi:hypothetical protein EON64_07995 [archaeon]|nr:MAG: hypothetical protein EON64_07995 [archaeon]
MSREQAKPATKSSNVKQSQPDSTATTNTLANQVFRLALFDHLPRKLVPKDHDSVEKDRILHPATIQLGVLFSRGVTIADDDRAHALVLAFLSIIEDYSTPPNKILREDLDKYISKQVGLCVVACIRELMRFAA